MKTITKLLAASAFALSMGTAAQAAVFIGISTDGGATINEVFTSADATYEWLGANIGGYETISVEGDAPLAGSGLLHSDVVNVNSSGAANVSIFITRTDLTAIPNGFFSSFTSNSINNRFTINESTLVDDGNQKWVGVGLASANFTNVVGASSANFSNGPVPISGSFSVTHRYDISTTGGGSTSPTITLAAIPEPATWGLMIMGFGGAGAMIRSSRRRLATAA